VLKDCKSPIEWFDLPVGKRGDFVGLP